MAKSSELTLKTRLFLKTYRYRKVDPIPWVPLSKPLSECRVGLVSSAGFVPRGMQPFDEAVRGGDTSWRRIPKDTDPAELADCHRSESFDHTGMLADPNLSFPLTRLKELQAAGVIGSVVDEHVSIMGSITVTGPFTSKTGPALAEHFKAQGADLVLLVPV
jgi:D-proline reductase (dithiol) PrdB